ncbi:protein of unknown function DUF1289 [Methylomonas methanica MC09]|uniref:Fe-S protein n=2 Tax=Methylomonas methanica TaxID=421 RepID=G0A1D8_METMM|nr:DUF1289 domain-containing protein [Methylomonas methanica]AEF98831.1 protein of unknown function DUF1289 [Methylomonas methanica MC09]
MTEEAEKIPSPCVRNCCLNEQNICLGCFRSLDEICGWAQAHTQLRQQFLANAKLRRQSHSQLYKGLVSKN